LACNIAAPVDCGQAPGCFLPVPDGNAIEPNSASMASAVVALNPVISLFVVGPREIDATANERRGGMMPRLSPGPKRIAPEKQSE
jgi:hypothetical protein